ncbi:MAG: response regulator [candidate division Zixibacteria bacterium]|nr:response regulator [candidate division Zixibacteria bacterium]
MIENKAKIVIVAEDYSQMQILTEALESNLHSVIIVKNLDFAESFLERDNINLLIIDFSGISDSSTHSIQRIKSRYPETSVILITGQSEPYKLSMLQVDGIVSKPFRINHIEELIAKALSNTPAITKKNENFLVVDDDDIFRTLLIRSLNLAGYTALGASDGNMAIDILKTGTISFVITDVNMPYLDGVSLLNQIKQEWPHIPVVLITGYFSAGESPTSENATPDGFLMKPFKIQQIMELLQEIMDK